MRIGRPWRTEAMAARCSVVVSSLGCFGDLVTEGQTGLVFDHAGENPDEILADCLARLMKDEGLRKNLALRGQQHSKKYDYPEVSKFILEDLALLTGTVSNKSRL